MKQKENERLKKIRDKSYEKEKREQNGKNRERWIRK